jgi:hypothetical protein
VATGKGGEPGPAPTGGQKLAVALAFIAAALSFTAAAVRYSTDGGIDGTLVGGGLFMVALGLSGLTRLRRSK